MKLKKFFCQFPNPWTLRVSGMGGYTSKCEKSQNNCTLLHSLAELMPWNRFLGSLKGQCHEIFASSFFHESPSPKPLIIPLGSFRIFPKIRGENLPPVLTMPAANLPPVSTTPVAICHRNQRHRWQIMGTISGCRYLKVNLNAKIYVYVSSTTQR